MDFHAHAGFNVELATGSEIVPQDGFVAAGDASLHLSSFAGDHSLAAMQGIDGIEGLNSHHYYEGSAFQHDAVGLDSGFHHEDWGHTFSNGFDSAANVAFDPGIAHHNGMHSDFAGLVDAGLAGMPQADHFGMPHSVMHDFSPGSMVYSPVDHHCLNPITGQLMGEHQASVSTPTYETVEHQMFNRAEMLDGHHNRMGITEAEQAKNAQDTYDKAVQDRDYYVRQKDLTHAAEEQKKADAAAADRDYHLGKIPRE